MDIIVKAELSDDLPRVEGANFFAFSFLGEDVQLMVGYLDPHRFHMLTAAAKEEGAESVEVTPEITHRFLMSRRGFELLKRQMDAIRKKLDSAGEESEELETKEDEHAERN